MQITDKVCCGFTILIILIYLGLMGASFAMGPMEHIAKPYDMNGQLCQGSYIYFLTPQEGFLFRTACLNSCPKAKDSTLSCSSPNIKCTPNNSPTNPSEQVVVYDTDLYNNFACLPTDYKLFQIVMEGMNVPSLQLYASKLKGDYIGILFGAFTSIFLGILLLKLQKSYSSLIIQIINIAYPIVITLVLLFLINSVSEFTKANVIDQLGDKRPLINTSMALLLDSHFNKIYLVLLVMIFVIWLIIGLLDIKFNSISVHQVHLRNYIQLSFFKSIKYIYVPLTLTILLIINFAVFYQSIISSIGIGAISNGMTFYQNSPIGFAFIGVQTILFIYISMLICVYGDAIMFVQSHRNFQRVNNGERSHLVLECLGYLGSVSYFVLKIIYYLPTRWSVDFLYLINKTETAKIYEKKLYSLNTTTLAHLFIEEDPEKREKMSLRCIMDNFSVQTENENETLAQSQSLYNSGCSFIYKNGFFFMNLLIFGQLMLGTSVCGAILISLLAYQISYIYGVQFSKGACAMQLFQREIQQEEQDMERGELVVLNLFDYMVKIYKWIRHVEKSEKQYQQKQQQ